MPNNRLQKDTRTIWYPEGATTPGADTGIGTGYVVPVAGESGVSDTQDPARMPITMGDGLSDSLVPGLIMHGGSLPIGLDFDFIGHPLSSLWTGYSAVASGDGTNNLHEFFEDVATYGARPRTFQLQDEQLEATATYVRGRYFRTSGMELRGDFAGGAQVTLQVMGNGDVVLTDLAGTKTNLGFLAASYFDGRASYEVSGVIHQLTGTTAPTAFSCRFNRSGAGREEAFFNQGAAAHINPGVMNVDGDIGVPSNVGGTGPAADLTMYSDGVYRRVVVLDWVLADGPILTCTKYLRIQVVGYVFRSRPRVGSPQKYNARFEISRMAAASMRVPGEYHSNIRGPYLIDATNNQFAAVIDGVAKTVALTNGAARTTDQIVADLNANAPFFAVAYADNFLGWVRMTTRTKGAAGSVQFNTGLANSSGTVLGFNNVARAGRNDCQSRMLLRNAIATNVYRP